MHIIVVCGFKKRNYERVMLRCTLLCSVTREKIIIDE